MVDCSNKITILSDSLCLTAWVNRSPLTHLVVYSRLVARKCLSKPNKFETLSVCLELAIVDCFFFPSSSSSATVLALYSIFFYNEHISVCVTTTGEKEKKNNRFHIPDVPFPKRSVHVRDSKRIQTVFTERSTS